MLQEQPALELEPVFQRCDDYATLQRVLRARALRLPITRNDIDECAGLDRGVSGGALAENFSRRLGAYSLYNLLAVLGLSLIVVDTRDAIERSQKLVARFPNRDDSQCRWGNRARKAGKAKKEASRPKSRSAKKRAA
jgi:hypothetical protein